MSVIRSIFESYFVGREPYEGIWKIRESINDKFLFKAFWMAGGPGSGKSFIANMAFKGHPVVFVNSDASFEYLLKKNNLPFDIRDMTTPVGQAQGAARSTAKRMAKGQLGQWINGMLPLIIDGTGKDLSEVQAQVKNMKNIGYDCGMVFVNTSLEVALERNRNRQRTVPEEIVTKSWKAVQENIGGFQKLFGLDNFKIVDNSQFLSDDEIQKLQLELFRHSMKFLQKPLKNPIGIAIVEVLKAKGGKYLTDLVPGDLTNQIKGFTKDFYEKSE